MPGTYPSPTFASVALQTPLAVTQGGSGATTAPAALTALGAAALAGSGSQTFNVGFPTAATHAIPLTGAPINVKWFGAKGDGVTDDTAAFVAALATGRNVYMPGSVSGATGYYITNTLTLSAPGQVLEGDLRTTSYFVVKSTFNMAATGVIVFAAPVNQPPVIRRIGIQFTQPDTPTYSALTTYPVAVYAPNQPRFEIRECLFSNATSVINMTGNSGGAYLDDIQMSFYGTAINIDGSLDWVRVHKLHAFPFNMTTNQSNLFLTSASVGYAISSGRCDGLILSDCLFINSQQIFLFQGTGANPGPTFGAFSNVAFDTNPGLTMQAGDISMSGCYFSRNNGIANQPAIYLTGGNLRISSAMCIFATGTQTFPMINVAAVGSGTTAFLQMDNCTFECGSSGDTTTVLLSQTTGTNNAMVSLSNCMFIKPQNGTYTKPVVQQTSGRLSMSNCRITDKGTATGTFIYINGDDWHRIIGNASLGWSNTFPTATLAVYQYN
jgi:hypothetical protein